MDVIRAIRTEPVVSDFLVQPVPNETIKKIVSAGHHVQSNYHSQDWRFIVVSDLDRLRALSENVRHHNLMSDAAFTVIPVTSIPSSGEVDLLLEGQIIAYMQLAAWDFGIASYLCPIVDPGRFKQILHVPDHLVFNTAVSFGIPAGGIPKGLQHRRAKPATITPPLADVVKWEHW